jgi:hypothetical protein
LVSPWGGWPLGFPLDELEPYGRNGFSNESEALRRTLQLPGHHILALLQKIRKGQLGFRHFLASPMSSLWIELLLSGGIAG